MTVWFSSDLHLGHVGVIDFCKRPYRSVTEMDAELIDGWNKNVHPNERVYCLGDMSFWTPAIGVTLLKRLNGQKILIRGNHDKYSLTQYRQSGFIDILEEAVITVGGQRVRLSHYPYLAERGTEPEYEYRYPQLRPKRDPGEFLLCGHVHGLWKVRPRQINVGVDVWGYRPVSNRVIESLICRGLREEDEFKSNRFNAEEKAGPSVGVKEPSQAISREEGRASEGDKPSSFPKGEG